MTWLRPETFAELDLPLRIVPLKAQAFDPAREWIPLRRDAREDLYDWYDPYSKTKIPFFTSLNPAGEVELMYLFDDDRVRDDVGCPSTECAIRVVTAADNCFAVEIVFYQDLLVMKVDAADGGPAPVYGHLGRGQPFRAYFCFLTHNVRDRFKAAALCEQPVVRLFLLSRWNGPLVAARCREIVISDLDREVLRAALLRAYVPAVKFDDESARRAAMGYHDMGILPEQIADEEIMADGLAYTYDTEAADARLGRSGALSYYTGRLRQALLALGSDSDPAVRRGPFFGWATNRRLRDARGRWRNGAVLFVTPAAELPRADKVLRETDGFVRVEPGSPLRSLAAAVFKYDRGVTYAVAGDYAAGEDFYDRLVELRQERYGMGEIYDEALGRGHGEPGGK